MQKTIAMIFALRALFAPASAAIETRNPATRRQEIVRVANAYVRAMLASDAAVVATLYEEDAVEMPNCRPLVKGRAAIEQVLSWPHEGGEDHSFVLTHTESTISGDTAYDVGTYIQRPSTRDGMVDDTGKYIRDAQAHGRRLEDRIRDPQQRSAVHDAAANWSESIGLTSTHGADAQSALSPEA